MTKALASLNAFRSDFHALRSEDGATAVEYGLMVALIAMAIFGGVWVLGPQLLAVFTEVGDSLA